MAYEQKPNSFNLFKDNEEKLAKRRDFYTQKGWDLDGIPTYSGKLLLDDGSEVMLEARIIEGKNGKFFGGRAWRAKPKDTSYAPRPAESRAPARQELDDEIPF